VPRSLDPLDLAACEALLKKGSKSFSAAALVLPTRVRASATVLYAFCRIADDLVDDAPAVSGAPDAAGARAAVRELSARLDRIYADQPDDHPVDRALCAVVGSDDLPRAPLDALIDGFAWDAEGHAYDTIDDLLGYAARVAGSVGVAMTALMGSRDKDVLARACDLGVAMQLTNVARDVGEDAARGRLYLPRTWLMDAGVDGEAFLAKPAFSDELGRVICRLLNLADVLYARADEGIPALPPECRPAVAAARLVYADIGRAIRAAGFDSVSQRARVSSARKVWLVTRALGARFGRTRGGLLSPPLETSRFLIEASAKAR
jgi:phytoene synthase